VHNPRDPERRFPTIPSADSRRSRAPIPDDGGDGARTSKVGLRGGRQRNAVQGQSPWRCCGEYRAAHLDGFGYIIGSSEHYDAFKSRLRPTMRQSYSAGKKVFADFAGDAIDVVDPTTAEVRSMKLFVAVMGASNYIFAQARPSEQVAMDRRACGPVRLSGRLARSSWSATISKRRHKPVPLRAGPEPSQVLST
jgi:hypothetical protein